MKEYYRHLLSSHFERDAIKEIDNLLTEELAKPEQIRDYDKIDELTDILPSNSTSLKERSIKELEMEG